jgi:preprotein translocase subunit SecG
MVKILPYVQIILAILLTSAILLQHRGTGLGGAFASESNIYRSKRGIEKFLFYLTIVLAFLFVIAAIFNIVIR